YGKNKNYQEGHISDLSNPPFYAVVHPWITPTEEELQMSYLITLGLVETIFDLVVDRVKMVLVGATTIKRDRLHNEVVNELVVFYGAAASAGVGPAAAGGGVAVGAVVVCSAFLCKTCKKNDEDYVMYLKKFSEAVNELKNKRGVKGIVPKNVWHAYTPRSKRRK
ncbi:hypothetical protein EJD97_023313, partial [Solanum chilense]